MKVVPITKEGRAKSGVTFWVFSISSFHEWYSCNADCDRQGPGGISLHPDGSKDMDGGVAYRGLRKTREGGCVAETPGASSSGNPWKGQRFPGAGGFQAQTGRHPA